MSRRLGALLFLCGAMIAVLSTVVVRASLTSGKVEAASLLQRAAATQQRLQELAELRATVASVESKERPEQDLIARVEEALASAGLNSTYLRDLVTEGDRALGQATGYRTQSVALTLSGLVPAQLGRFVGQWESTQPTWTIERVELTHPEAAGQAYDVRVLLAATYLSPEAR